MSSPAPQPDSAPDHVAAVDLGGTKTAVCLVDRDGATGPVLTRPTPAQEGPETVLHQVVDLVHETAGGRPLAGVGVGTAGAVDARTGVVTSSTDAMRDWVGTPVADRLRIHLGVPVAVDNDVNAHAAGEVWRGAAVGASSVLMVTIGTGVGAGVVLDGVPLRGAHHLAGEMGHMPAPGAGHLRCSCGRPGHVEAIASGPGLLRHYHALGGDPHVADARGVVAAAGADDPVAARAVEDAARALGQCLAGVVTVVDPEVVVVGGGLADAGADWWATMEATLRSEVVDALAELPVRRPSLGATAALVGAARHIWEAIDRAKEEW